MLIPMLAVCLVASMLGAPEAKATDDPFEQTDGLWVGDQIGDSLERVTFELRGKSMVLLAPNTVAVLSLGRWEVAGPGGKGGDIQLKTTATALAGASRSGMVKAQPKGLVSLVRLRLWTARKEAVMCVSDPRKKIAAIRVVPSWGDNNKDIEAGVTCYSLRQAYAPADAVAPVPAPAPPIPPEKAPDFECMRECRQQNMMRAVGPEVIDADCRAACSKP